MWIIFVTTGLICYWRTRKENIEREKQIKLAKKTQKSKISRLEKEARGEPQSPPRKALLNKSKQRLTKTADNDSTNTLFLDGLPEPYTVSETKLLKQ